MTTDIQDPVARAAALLKGHRESIDRLDAILVYTLAERFKHTQDVGVLKAEHDLPPSDPNREAKQTCTAGKTSPQIPGWTRNLPKKFLNFVIEE